MTDRPSPQPFRGGSLPRALVQAIQPALHAYGAAHLLRAMVLAWRDLKPAERDAFLLKADTPDSATAAITELHVEPGVADPSVKKAYETAQATFPTMLDTLTADELFVAKKRLVAHDAPTLEAVAAALGYTRAGAQKIEARATWKLRRWLVELLEQHRG